MHPNTLCVLGTQGKAVTERGITAGANDLCFLAFQIIHAILLEPQTQAVQLKKSLRPV